MSAQGNHNRSQLAIEIEQGLRRRIEAAAAEQGMSLRDYVVAALRSALERGRDERPAECTRAWSQLSAPAFERDWDSDADAIYDDLA